MMQTDDLIHMLSQDAVKIKKMPSFRWPLLYGAAFMSLLLVIATLIPASGLGIRDAYMTHIMQFTVVLKQVLPLFLLLCLIPIGAKLIYPETISSKKAQLYIMCFVVLAAILFFYTLYQEPRNSWQMQIEGKSLFECLTLIPLLSLFTLGAEITWLRKGAPSNPIQAGFYAGLIAGGIACFFYAFHCTEDSPLFYALWYTLGIFIAGGLGAVSGRLFLKW